jgi:hypothetical protein
MFIIMMPLINRRTLMKLSQISHLRDKSNNKLS